jgi:hypothetical protein
MYTYTTIPNSTSILRSDGQTIPNDPRNSDWMAYDSWLAAGNTPTAYVAPALTWPQYLGTVQAELDFSDNVATRCVKAGVAYPAAWLTRDQALRALMRATSGDVSVPILTFQPRPAFPEGT